MTNTEKNGWARDNLKSVHIRLKRTDIFIGNKGQNEIYYQIRNTALVFFHQLEGALLQNLPIGRNKLLTQTTLAEDRLQHATKIVYYKIKSEIIMVYSNL